MSAQNASKPSVLIIAMKTNLKKTLKTWRRKHGLSRERAAKLLNLSPSTLKTWEFGLRKPKALTTAGLLAKMAEVDLAEQEKPKEAVAA
ncbi:MAG: helix-turn-helix domain-containing protein [Limisphaerales bacterium]